MAEKKLYLHLLMFTMQNAIMYKNTRYPLYLMFGRHQRPATDAFLRIGSYQKHKSHQDKVDQLKDCIQYAYEKAEIEARNRRKELQVLLSGCHNIETST